MEIIEDIANWWTIEWYKLVINGELEELFSEGKDHYLENKSKLNYKIEDNEFLELEEYDRSFFGISSPSISFKKFEEDEKEEIKNSLLNSPFYLKDLLANKFPKSLYDELKNKNIYLIPKSLDDLTFKGFKKNKFTIETMAMFYFFGLLIENNPSLLFKISGFDLNPSIKKYIDVNYEIKKMVPKIIRGEGKNSYKENKATKEEDLEKLLKEALNSINFDKIPNSEKTLELLFEYKNNSVKREIKNVLERLNYFKSQMLMTNKSGFNFDIFVAILNGDEEYKQFKESDDTFSNNYRNNDFKKVRLLLDKNYNLKSITGFSHDYKTHFLFFEFFENTPWWTIVNYEYKIQFIYTIYQFSLNLLEKIAIVPELLKKDEKYLIRWIPAFLIEEVKDIFEKLSMACPKNLVLFDNKTISSDEQLKILISLFIYNIIEKAYFGLKYIPRTLNLSKEIYELLFTLKLTEIPKENLNLTNAWISELHSLEKEKSLIFLISNKDDAFFNLNLEINSENQLSKIDEILNLDISSEDQLSKIDEILSESLATKNSPPPISFNEKIKKLDEESKFKLFHEINNLEMYFPQIRDLIASEDGIFLNTAEFADFYQNTIPILNTLNFKVILPKNLNYTVKPRIVSNIKLKSSNITEKNLLSLENLVDFDWKIAIKDKEISIAEFKKLVKISSKFIKIDDESYLVNPEDIDEISEKINQVPKKLKNNHLLQAILSSNYDNKDINIDENILQILDKIKDFKDVSIPSNLNGTLRPYQYRGFSWLVQNIKIGFGSILADDMGLGKTLQVLTTILHFKNEGFLKSKKVLVVAPTAILFNWEKEIKHFTPSLTYDIFHGKNQSINPEVDITISSYGMIRNNLESFNEVEWFMVVVDEAQNIKNPNTKQSKAIKKIRCENKIALTGTPVENCLIDYWSIFDFTNKSYLDGVKNFKENYVNPIERERDEIILNRFKAISSPFILRRMKTDKKIISDLPDKVVTDCYCPLSEIQVALYKSTIDKTLEKIEESEGIQRKGMVFKLINSLKQICNHPSHFTGSDEFGIEESGKMKMLIDILGNILENKEKIIIFTQFVKMGDIIVKLLTDKFKTEIMFYHGSLTRKMRDKIIDEFQNNEDKQILIVSLKAGGTGLNLTSANHVVHFDLWWNPAVENQATDRVFRIGQDNNVFVYRFISNKTFEEKINEILISKKELAEVTVGTGEKFITEMSNKELQELISLM
ncbi:MAG: SNF2-related protein [Methanobrevibacter sp.]|nr:SNF2-related protein [Methanobrevibacter sp.]